MRRTAITLYCSVAASLAWALLGCSPEDARGNNSTASGATDGGAGGGVGGAGGDGSGAGGASSGTSTGGAGGFGPGNPIFEDDFDYELERIQDIQEKRNIVGARGWNWFKDENQGMGEARGYIYTVEPGEVDGHIGTFPAPSQRALLFEAHPGNDLIDHQADFYIQQPEWPANLWLRFWVYIVDSGPMGSTYDDNNKFLYPADSYPAQEGQYAYLLLLGRLGFEHQNPAHLLDPNTAPPNELYLNCQGVGAVNTNAVEGPSSHMYQNLDYGTRLTPNAWFEVTIHIDVSTDTGVYEAWLRPRNGARVKVAEWISGATPGFTWVPPVETRDGMAYMSTPVSVNQNPDPVMYGSGDSYTLMQHWAVADSEANLPSFGVAP